MRTSCYVAGCLDSLRFAPKTEKHKKIKKEEKRSSDLLGETLVPIHQKGQLFLLCLLEHLNKSTCFE